MDRLPPVTRGRILAKIEKLALDPYRMQGVKALQAREGYRLKVGNYRVICDILDDVLVIVVVKIADRKDVY